MIMVSSAFVHAVLLKLKLEKTIAISPLQSSPFQERYVMFLSTFGLLADNI